MALQALARDRGVNAHFLVVSFDPADRPEVLEEFARRTEVDLKNWDFATGPPGTVGPLARTLNTYFRPSSGEMFEHNIVVAVVDARGILRDEFFGADWDPGVVLEALRRAGS
jgi:cytochrome oxidase Cu insertion factor (SCO1/SenC/PrrC family)